MNDIVEAIRRRLAIPHARVCVPSGIPIGGLARGLNTRLRVSGQIIVVLKNTLTGAKRTMKTHNIVTNAGDHYYAQTAAEETKLFTVAGMRLGTNAGAATSPVKGDVKLQTTTTSALLASSEKAIDATYPKSDDGDGDNTGSGVDIVTWRTSWLVSESNSANIATVDLPDSLTDGSITQSLSIANFASKFTKSSSDTLKVFVNHTFNGV